MKKKLSGSLSTSVLLKSLNEFSDRKSAQVFVQIFDCAHFLGMSHLKERMLEILKDYCTDAQKRPLCSLCDIYDEATHNPAAEELKMCTMKCLCMDMKALKKGVSMLGREVIIEIVSNPSICANEIDLFKLVMRWLSVFPSCIGRISSAKECIKCLDLSKIDPLDLMGSVAGSGLVSEDMFLTAYREQALHARSLGYGEFKKQRKE